jgi:hypothetical protein
LWLLVGVVVVRIPLVVAVRVDLEQVQDSQLPQEQITQLLLEVVVREIHQIQEMEQMVLIQYSVLLHLPEVAVVVH